jgi:y4mF family transcriptional regulator
MERKPQIRVLDMTDVGLAIRKARKKLGLTQAELAGLCALGTRFVSEVERGKESAEVAKVLLLLHSVGIDVFLQPRDPTL